MKTELELNAKIMAITMKIMEKHPELSELLNEMPITIPNVSNPDINIKLLEEYYESLDNILNHLAIIMPSHPRLDSNRQLDAPMLNFDLPSIVERIKQEEDWISGKHNAITLMKSDIMRIVLIAMHEGNEMEMHKTGGPISIHIIEGKLTLATEKDSIIIHKGHLLTLHENIKHGLTAIDETIILLTILHERNAQTKTA
jgi:quercetin dioxygenase-like cupin family protein